MVVCACVCERETENSFVVVYACVCVCERERGAKDVGKASAFYCVVSCLNT